MFDSLLSLIRQLYGESNRIGLHEPVFGKAEQQAMADVIASGMVSSVGACVDHLERLVADYTGVAQAVATVNGSSALQVGLHALGVRPGDLVLTQSLTFVATCNAIAHCGAEPVFLDVDRRSLGLSPQALQDYLQTQVDMAADGTVRRRHDGRRIVACMPMHTFGNPADMKQLCGICQDHGIAVIEDSAEALGSRLDGRHCGTFGRLGILSFNGNKILTTGGGGMLLVDDSQLADRLRHLTTTARVVEPRRWTHDEVAWNHRMPNLNAALGVAQFGRLPEALQDKRELAAHYQRWAVLHDRDMVAPIEGADANHWLNALICESADERDRLLRYLDAHGVQARPVWEPMHHLPMYRSCQCGPLEVTEWAAQRLINLPSSVRPAAFGELSGDLPRVA